MWQPSLTGLGHASRSCHAILATDLSPLVWQPSLPGLGHVYKSWHVILTTDLSPLVWQPSLTGLGHASKSCHAIPITDLSPLVWQPSLLPELVHVYKSWHVILITDLSPLVWQLFLPGFVASLHPHTPKELLSQGPQTQSFCWLGWTWLKTNIFHVECYSYCKDMHKPMVSTVAIHIRFIQIQSWRPSH